MSAVNWGEVFYAEWKYRGEVNAHEAKATLRELPIVVIPADQDRATRAAALKQKHNLGYADAFAAELAIEQERGWLPPIQNFPSWGKYCRSIRYPGMKDESPLRARGVLTAEAEKYRAFRCRARRLCAAAPAGLRCGQRNLFLTC